MRTLTFYLAALVSVLGIATAAQSAVIIDFESGGTNSISLNTTAAGSSITVDLYVTVTGGTSLSGYQFTITYDSDVVALSANSLTQVDPGIASWTQGGAGVALDGGDGAIGSAFSASTLNTPADDLNAANTAGGVYIGSLKFVLAGFTTDGVDISGCLNCDAIKIDTMGGSGDLTTTFNGLAINVVPEPTTASLLGLGLLGLTVAGRRRN